MKPGDVVKCERGRVGTLVACRTGYHVVRLDGELHCLRDHEFQPFPRSFVILHHSETTGYASIEWSGGERERVDASRLRLLQAAFPWRDVRAIV